MPLVSRMPFPGTAGFPSRSGRGAVEKVLPVPLKAKPFSVSTTTPLLVTTSKTAAAVTPPALAPGSKMVALTWSAQPYRLLSKVAVLAGKLRVVPAIVCVPIPCTGPAITRPYGCPSASRYPSPSLSSPGSRRPLPFPVQVPVSNPVQHAAGSPAALHWAFDVSSDAPVSREMDPPLAPPIPRFTRTPHVPATSCESAGLPSPFGSADRCTASTGLRVSETSVAAGGRARLHCPSLGPPPPM